ncbi:MAG: PHP domain-containing protein [Jatrophihabitantaceae bacterium]
MRIDLHAHTTASDGTDSPAQLVVAAVAAGLDVLAVTDHDTTAGWTAALAARPPSLTIVPGAEFSCAHHDATGRRITLHLLGYLFDPAHEGLRAERARQRASRLSRGQAIVAGMQADGVPISWAQVSRLAEGGAVGRPHIGRALVEAGVVPDVSAAFAGILSARSRYYVRKADMDVFTAVALIREAGGLPIFAHPLARRRGPVVGDDVIAAMAAAGLVGLEVDHPDQDRDDRAHVAGLARELGLIGTGSSDYHGTNKATRLGECTTDPAAFEQLLALASASRPVGHRDG